MIALTKPKPSQPPRIWGWQNSQLSVARHWGACSYNGAHYVIDEATEGQPLVRLDVLAAENKAKAQAVKRAAAAERARAGEMQGDLL